MRRDGFRMHMVLLVAATVGGAALISKGLLALGVESMTWRYPVAAVASYGIFLGLVRVWLWYLLGARTSEPRQRGDWEPDLELPEFELPDWDFGLDELFVPVVMLVAVVGLSLAGVYVIWTAPGILAEIAAEAVLCAGLGWMWRTIGRTWLPMAAIVVLVFGVGWALEKRCPEAVKMRQAMACPVVARG